MAALLPLAGGGIHPAGASSLHEAIRLAWAQDPLRHSLTVDSHAAGRNADAARSWFPGGPVVSGQYFDDHFIGSNQGYTTYQTGVSVPFWLPGQGTATVRSALADQDVARAHLEVERMAIAVRVLDLATTAALCAEQVQALADERRALDSVEGVTHRLLSAGEVSAADSHAVSGEREDVENQLANAQEQLADARAGLEELTGRDEVPDLSDITGRTLVAAHPGNLDLAIGRDPRLRLAQAQVAAARAKDRLVQASFMPNPELGVDAIHEKQYGSPWNTRVGVQVSVPLPSAARNVPMRMQAVREIAAAERDAQTAQRMIRAEYTRTRVRLASAVTILAHATSKRQALASRVDDLEKAWEVGEVSVIEYLRARRDALAAQQQERTASVAWHSAIARILISAGSTP
ncbi:TolC family protein [Gluconacetobacter azotocaptans]|uniref:TolC family protein n=2 Tax=Gluconacetobacter azotocaptans TaxID=142834 RepID=A0A7W4JQE6_9PROT|nr:TolC family protein [Gluconacetobacter azotocaptans]MBB2189010.1 TolC family protein [Gluconacetobacter azotocaptans]MBM9403607.1 TolC family protein [Gluconacetobacter azotocaptans]